MEESCEKTVKKNTVILGKSKVDLLCHLCDPQATWCPVETAAKKLAKVEEERLKSLRHFSKENPDYSEQDEIDTELSYIDRDRLN